MREQSQLERSIFSRLMSVKFEGREELKILLSNSLVSEIDSQGSLSIHPTNKNVRSNSKQIPVEAELRGLDGIGTHILLHVRDGQPCELEIYTDDGSEVSLHEIDPNDLTITTIPPYPVFTRKLR